ncbi:MAG: glycosyl hydrolase, partial [Candidatus Acidiferrales bacterium]
LYHGAQMVLKSTDQGQTWEAISPDLTRNDKSKQPSSGGPITKDNTSVEYYDTVFAIAPSPLEKDQIWVGSDDGLVHLTRDGGKNWSNITPKELPEWGTVSLIDASTRDAGAAYMAVDAHRLDNFHPYIFKTADFGKSWTKITNGIPDGAFVHAVREDPKQKGLLFAGTETGIYFSFDDGANWQPLQLNLPRAPIHDLAIHENDLIVATHGRAFWILDDIAPLRQMAGKTIEDDVYLFHPSLAYRFRGGGGGPVPRVAAMGANPPNGAIIDYSLKALPKEPVTLEILDGTGKSIRKYKSNKEGERVEAGDDSAGARGGTSALPTEAGLNRFVWDLRYEPPSRVPGAISWGGRPVGPIAVPGEYQVKLTVSGKSYTAPLEVKEDPRIEASQADLEKQLDLALKIRDRVSAGHDAVNQIRSVRAQIDALKKRLDGNEKDKAVLSAADELNKKMSAIESQIIQPKSKSNQDPLNYPIMTADQLMALASTVESGEGTPTAASYTVFDELSKQLDDQLAKWKEIQEKDLAALNELIRKENIAAVAPAYQKPE